MSAELLAPDFKAPIGVLDFDLELWPPAAIPVKANIEQKSPLPVTVPQYIIVKQVGSQDTRVKQVGSQDTRVNGDQMTIKSVLSRGFYHLFAFTQIHVHHRR